MAIDPKDLSILDQVAVETEVEGEPVALPAFVSNVFDDELWLATRVPDRRLTALRSGQPIHMSFERGEALVVESEFLRCIGRSGHSGTETPRVFAVRRPRGVENVQRRAHVRADLERPVRIRSLGTLGADKMGMGRTVNVGAGGVNFATEMPLMFGQLLRIALVLTSRDIIVAEGQITRIEDYGDPAAPAPGRRGSKAPVRPSCVAVKFDSIRAPDRELISIHILAARRKRIAAASEANLLAAAEVAIQSGDPEPALVGADSVSSSSDRPGPIAALTGAEG
jgi:c-di-GMP-binding flagellar brake protein YcgR